MLWPCAGFVEDAQMHHLSQCFYVTDTACIIFPRGSKLTVPVKQQNTTTSGKMHSIDLTKE